MTNKEQIFGLIQKHPEGLDDDDISKMTGIGPRQQVQQLCSQLASAKRIPRQSVSKAGKRRKIHNFPADTDPLQNDCQTASPASPAGSEEWRRRLAALVAATGRSESDLLEESLHLLGLKVLTDRNTSREVRHIDLADSTRCFMLLTVFRRNRPNVANFRKGGTT